MPTSEHLILGFDPGGKNGFGLAWLQGSKSETYTVSSVAEAVDWTTSYCKTSKPFAAGVDTLLHWSDKLCGWRDADRHLIEKYQSTAKSVVSPNGLYGAMAIGGMGLAIRLRQHWPDIQLNETHPKVLIPALGARRYRDRHWQEARDWFCEKSGLDVHGLKNSHELDALISAWATGQALECEWKDIVGQNATTITPAGPVTYFWPD